jgi:hypothetical protein
VTKVLKDKSRGKGRICRKKVHSGRQEKEKRRKIIEIGRRTKKI